MPKDWRNKSVDERVEDFSLDSSKDFADPIGNTFKTITGADDFKTATDKVTAYLSQNEDRVQADATGTFQRIEHLDSRITEMPQHGARDWISYQRRRALSEEQLMEKLGTVADNLLLHSEV